VCRSYGAVYKAVHKQTGVEVAIKILPADEDLSTLKKEIDFLKRLTCDYVVGYLGCYLFEEELWVRRLNAVGTHIPTRAHTDRNGVLRWRLCE
jgi:serine/threonine protein kinase